MSTCSGEKATNSPAMSAATSPNSRRVHHISTHMDAMANRHAGRRTHQSLPANPT